MKEFMHFPRVLKPKLSVIARMEFELAYLEATVQHFSHYASGILSRRFRSGPTLFLCCQRCSAKMITITPGAPLSLPPSPLSLRFYVSFSLCPSLSLCIIPKFLYSRNREKIAEILSIKYYLPPSLSLSFVFFLLSFSLSLSLSLYIYIYIYIYWKKADTRNFF